MPTFVILMLGTMVKPYLYLIFVNYLELNQIKFV